MSRARKIPVEDRFFELSLDMLCVASLDGYFRRVNPAFEDTLGYTVEEMLSRPFIDFVHPEDHEATLAELASLAEGAKTSFENRYVRKDGSYAWLAWKAIPVLEEGLAYATARDITARKESEETLRLRDRAIAASTNGVVITDPNRPDDPIIYVNPAFASMTGYSAGEVVGKNCRFLQGADREQPALDALRESLRRGSPCTVVLRNYKKDGTFFWNELSVSPVHDSEGRLANFVGVQNDVTARLEAGEALRKSEERYRTLAAASASVVWTLDPKDGFVEPQPSWKEYTGQSWEDHRGFGWIEAIHPEDRERVLAAWTEARDSKGLYASDGRLWHEPSGTHRHVIARALPLLGERGEAREWIGMIGDVENLRRAEAEIRRLNERLEERVRERTAELAELAEELESFSYSVSHDLRAPIRHIGGFSRMLDERCGDALDETGRRYLDTIIRANHRAGDLVDGLLAFSRMGRSDMKRHTVDVNELVAETIEELEPDTNGRRVVWSVGDLPEVRGDRTMIRVAVRNLLANAVKYTRTRETASIEIGCEEDGDEFVFHVKDNGVGFDMAYVDKLFGVFQRLHGPEEFEGTGIGLASVKRVARRHGGRVWAEGAPDAGAAFYFALPKEERSRGGQGR